jgi:isohexenylglutaconyl-CoA hydratase
VTAALPECATLLLERDDPWLRVTLNRPETRNALSGEMVDELAAVFSAIADDRDIRAVILRGAGGTFCAGGDIKSFGEAQKAVPDGKADPLIASNMQYGQLLDQLNRAPQAVIAVIEGPVMGGGMGLTCITDIAIADSGATFALPEATLGLPASQVCLFVIQRIGLTRTRRLVVTGGRVSATEALGLGLIHQVCDDRDKLDDAIDAALKNIARCAPGAIAESKRVMLATGTQPLADLQADAAAGFAAALRGPEAAEGVAAFLQKRTPAWAIGGTTGEQPS